MRSWLLLPLLALAGCSGGTPEMVFRRSALAFSEGDVGAGASHFSRRLQAARPIGVLEAYYRSPENRKGVAFLLKDHRFRLVKEEGGAAVGEVTWTTGRTEPVYFVLEGGAWKLDLPPSEPQPEGTVPSVRSEGANPRDDPPSTDPVDGAEKDEGI